MRLRNIWAFLLLLSWMSMDAQSVGEAVRYSNYNYANSARVMGAGNAFSALGADISTASTNPAGLAEFRKSEFVLTFDFLNRNTESGFGGSIFDRDASTLAINQIGAVFVKEPLSTKWQTFNLAIGMNTLNLFHQDFNYEGTTVGSIAERFKELADGLAPSQLDNFEAGLAYDVQMLYDFEDDDIYETDFEDFSVSVPKSQVVNRSGSMREIFLTFAGNMNNQLSIGATFGMPIVRFEETKVYSENDSGDNIEFFEQSEFVEFLETTGVGLNGKIGVIYKMTNGVRLGASFHTPTVLFLRDVFFTDLNYQFTTDQPEDLTANSPESNFKYRITTPMRLILGGSYIYRAGKLRGFISAEAEYLSYDGNKFNLTVDSDNPVDLDFENELNGFIKEDLTSALNLRVGFEIGYSAFRFRAGYERVGDPYTFDAGDIGPKYSVGLGARGNKNYIDIAYQIQSLDNDYIPYFISSDARQPIVQNAISNRNIVVTAGFKF